VQKFIIIFLLLLGFSHKIYAQCPPGTYSISGHPRSEYVTAEGKYYSETYVDQYCKNYKNSGKLNLKFENQMPGRWPGKKEKFKPLTKKEKKLIKKIVESLPEKLTQVGDLRIYRADKSQDLGNPATSAPSEKIVVLYDETFKGDIKSIIAHELGHIQYNQLSTIELNEYLLAAGWKKADSVFAKAPDKNFSSEDGSAGPDEDFSNDIETFVTNPKKLKKISLKTYEWMKTFLRKKK